MNTPLNDHSIQENDDEEMSTLQDYDSNIDIEGEQNDHYQPSGTIHSCISHL